MPPVFLEIVLISGWWKVRPDCPKGDGKREEIMLNRGKKRQNAVLIAAVVAVVGGAYALPQASQAAVVTWTHTTASSWQTTGNWSTSALPGSTDDARFAANPTAKGTITLSANTAAGSIDMTTSPGALTFNSVTNNSTLTLNGASAADSSDGVANTILVNNSAKGMTIANGASTTLTIALGNATNNIIDVQNASGGITITSNIIDGAGGGKELSATGAGTLVLSGSNSFSGGLNVAGAEVDFTAVNSLGTGDISNTGSRLATSGTFNGTIASNHINLGSSAGSQISITGTNTITYNGVLQDLTSGGVLIKQGGGTLSLGGISTYTGGTTINNGTVQLTAGNNRLPTGTTLTLGQTGSTNVGSLNLNGFNQQIAGLISGTTSTAIGTNTLTSTSAATLTISGSDSYIYSDGTTASSGVITGSVAIVKSGTGTQTLGGSNSYSGPTTINGGALYINGKVTGSAVSVNGGTLGGKGTINGAVTLSNSSTTTIAPGGTVTSLSSLSVGSLNFADNANYNWQMGNASTGPGSGYDIVNVTNLNGGTGILDLSGLTANDFNINLWSLNGSSNGNATNFSSAVGGTWTLVSTTGGFTNGSLGLAGIKINTAANNGTGGFTNGLANGGFSIQEDGNNLDLIFTPSASPSLTWTALANNTWNTTVNTPNKNWNNGADPADYTENANVIFGDAGVGTVVVAAGGVTPGTIAFSNASGTYFMTGGAINGAGPLTKSNGGTVELDTSAGYAGATNINGGTLRSGTINALPTTTAVTLANTAGALLDLNGFNQTVASLSGGGSTGGNVALGGATLTLGDTSSPTFSGVISGSGTSSIVKTGGGTLILGGSNTYAGSTTINQGKIALVAGTGYLPSTTTVTLANVGSASLDLNGNNQTIAELSGGGSTGGNVILNTGTLTVGDGNDTTFGGSISGAGGSLVKTGAGKLALNGGVSYTGTTTVSNGTLEFGQVDGTTITLFPGTGSSLAGTITIDNAIRLNIDNGTFAGGGQIQIKKSGTSITNDNSTLTLAGTVGSNVGVSLNSTGIAFTKGDVSAATYTDGTFLTAIGGTTAGKTLTINGVISGNSDVSFENGIAGGGSGNLVLGGASTYTGTTSINVNNATIMVTTNNALPTTTDVIVGTNSGLGAATLDLNGFNQQIASLSDGSHTSATKLLNITVGPNGGNSTLTVSGSVTPSGNFSGSLSDGFGQLSLVKSGSNTLSLSGSNYYSGATSILNGTLQVTTNGVLGDQNIVFGVVNVGDVTANNSSPILTGKGNIGGLVTLNPGSLTGAQISPGSFTGTPGTLHLNGGLTANANSIFNFALSDTTAGLNDVLDTTTLRLFGSLTLNINAYSGDGLAGGFYTLINFTTIPNNTATWTINAPLDTGLGHSYSVVQVGNSIELDVTAPLPAAVTVTSNPAIPSVLTSGSTVTVANAAGVQRDDATLSALTVTSVNGIFSQIGLSNGAIAAGANQTGTIGFTAAPNLLNGTVPTGNLSFTISGGSTANPTGTGPYNFALSAPAIMGATAAFGVAQTAFVNGSQSIKPYSSTTAAGDTAIFLSGTTTESTTISETWHSKDSESAVLYSNVVDITGLGDPSFVYVLEMNYNPAGLSLAQQNALALETLSDGLWVNAVSTNTYGLGGDTGQHYFGAWANDPNNLVLGEWGVDTSNDMVWAVLNHNSEFGAGPLAPVGPVVPEPASLGLLTLGAVGLLTRKKRRTA